MVSVEKQSIQELALFFSIDSLVPLLIDEHLAGNNKILKNIYIQHNTKVYMAIEASRNLILSQRLIGKPDQPSLVQLEKTRTL